MTNDTGNGRSISVNCVHPALASSTPAEFNEHSDGLPVDPLRPALAPVTGRVPLREIGGLFRALAAGSSRGRPLAATISHRTNGRVPTIAVPVRRTEAARLGPRSFRRSGSRSVPAAMVDSCTDGAGLGRSGCSSPRCWCGGRSTRPRRIVRSTSDRLRRRPVGVGGRGRGAAIGGRARPPGPSEAGTASRRNPGGRSGGSGGFDGWCGGTRSMSWATRSGCSQLGLWPAPS